MEEITWVFSPNPVARGGSPAKVKKEDEERGERWREELFTSISPVFTHSG